jgi:hypothetical protein
MCHGDGAGRGGGGGGGGGVLRSPRAGREARRQLLVLVVVDPRGGGVPVFLLGTCTATGDHALSPAGQPCCARQPWRPSPRRGRGHRRRGCPPSAGVRAAEREARLLRVLRVGACAAAPEIAPGPIQLIGAKFRIFLGAVSLSRVLGFRFHSLTESNSKLASRFLIYKSFGVCSFQVPIQRPQSASFLNQPSSARSVSLIQWRRASEPVPGCAVCSCPTSLPLPPV